MQEIRTEAKEAKKMRNVKKYIEKALERGVLDDIQQSEIGEAKWIIDLQGLPSNLEYICNGFLFGFECGYKEAQRRENA